MSECMDPRIFIGGLMFEYDERDNTYTHEIAAQKIFIDEEGVGFHVDRQSPHACGADFSFEEMKQLMAVSEKLKAHVEAKK